ncbi:MAG: deoxyribose-phosphate aldolase [Flavobacterium sp.]
MEITNNTKFNIKEYLDSTYLKTADQAGVSEEENLKITQELVQQAIDQNYKLAMILPQYVAMARNMLYAAKSETLLGTVIDFPRGKNSLDDKLMEAATAILDGADELDFVVNYDAFRFGDLDLVKEQILECSKICLVNKKTVKWIIETAALNNDEIASITKLIRDVIVNNFEEKDFKSVFVKSSTGFFKTENNLPNGATAESISIMIANAKPLKVKASGGIKTRDQAMQMINLGVQRIGTSSADIISAE